MKFFITDESNIGKDDKLEFFVYGGIIVDEADIHELSKKLIKLKQDFNIEKERPIKWNNENWQRKGQLDTDTHKEIKKRILEAVKSSNCKLMIYLAPHDFYHSINIIGLKIYSKFEKDKYTTSLKYAINVCLCKFDSFLEENDDLGVIIADTFNTAHKLELSNHCFEIYPDGKDRPLKRIIFPVMQVENEYSHIHQINDIVLGSITYSMREMAENFLPILKDNFWKKDPSNYATIIGRGINIYPKTRGRLINKKILNLQDKIKRLIGYN